MQIELIDTFLDLCETRSFNQSAERLGVTQSTISGRIKALEKAIGRPLFTRSRAGTALTTAGLRFEPHARALRHGWITALNATRDSGMAGASLRIGLQHDLVGLAIGDLVARFRAALPETIFLLEADYSTQMCADLVTGAQDLAVLYTPKLHPDLYFQPLGEIRYRMVATYADHLAAIRPDTYILGNFAPAFAQSHAALLPELAQAPLSIGQNAAMVDLVTALQSAGYVLEHAAYDLAQRGKAQIVQDAPVVTQPVFAGVTLRNRHRMAYRRMVRLIATHFGATPAPERQKRPGQI
jgi:DNA-binding transcriptional LysR family regulator